MDIKRFLAERRDRKIHSREDLFEFARLAGNGGLPDYQLSAWLMAAVLNPLTLGETASLTLGMAASGERLDLTGLPKPWVDKHSTGGVGDKTTLVLLPLLAACGLTVVKMSGRGLGITGGTIDKLSAVPGFRTALSSDELLAQAKEVGIALAGQGPSLAPADKVLYALRDATETVASLPLIVSSILSKKIAGGAETVVLDVKCGSGGFMPDLASATALAEALVEVGTEAGLKVRAVISDMSQPLGAFVGNALEVNEAWSILAGEELSPPAARFRALCVQLARITLGVCGIDVDPEVVLASGGAIEAAKRWYQAQGATGYLAPVDALMETPVLAERDGYVARLDAGAVGRLVLKLGGGRVSKEDEIDLQVGAQVHVNVGDSVSAGDRILTVYSREAFRQESASAAELAGGIEISSQPVPAPELILAQVD